MAGWDGRVESIGVNPKIQKDKKIVFSTRVSQYTLFYDSPLKLYFLIKTKIFVFLSL